MRVDVVGLTKRFGDCVAVRDLHLAIQAGEVVGLLGANGAGKTTTARMLLGLVRPDAGTIILVPDAGTGPPGRRIGYAPQETGLQMSQSGWDNLVYWGGVFGLGPGESRIRGGGFAERLGLTAVLDRRVASLSVGEQRKLQLLTALLHEPELVILDEPTAFLDVPARQQVTRIVEELAAGGAGVLYSTHVLPEAESLCRRMLLLHEGATLYTGDTAGFVKRYGTLEVLVEHEPPGDRLAEELGRGARDRVRRVSGHELAVRSDDGDAEALVADIATRARALGVAVTSLRVQRPGLDSAFVNCIEERDG